MLRERLSEGIKIIIHSRKELCVWLRPCRTLVVSVTDLTHKHCFVSRHLPLLAFSY